MFPQLERSDNLSSRVTNEIESWMVEQRLQPGDRLPAERVLAEQFGVSRTVIREAVRALSARGLLVVHPGSGTIVTQPSSQIVSRSISLFLGLGDPTFLKALEVRQTIEVEVAALAADRRTDADIQELETACNELRDVDGDVEAFARADVRFHLALAAATQNELFVLLMESISDLLLDMRRKAFDVADTTRRALSYHEDILARVLDGDSEGARVAMNAHLTEARETQERAWATYMAGIERESPPADTTSD